MKRFLSLFIAVALGAAMFVPAAAQNAGPGAGAPKPGQGGFGGDRRGGGGGMMIRGKMKEIQTRVLGKLGLTAKQKADIKALDEKTQKQVAAIMPKPKAGAERTRPTEAQMTKIRNLTKSHQDSFMKILTKAQQEKYKKLMAEEMKKLQAERDKNGGGRPGGKPAGSKP